MYVTLIYSQNRSKDFKRKDENNMIYIKHEKFVDLRSCSLLERNDDIGHPD